jgi:hypothetical protein
MADDDGTMELVMVLLILIGGAIAAYFLLKKKKPKEGSNCTPSSTQTVSNAATYSIQDGKCVANTCMSTYALNATNNTCNRDCTPYATINDTLDESIRLECFPECYGTDNTLLSESEVSEVNKMICGFSSSGTPAAGTPAAGTPAAGTPAAGTPAAGTPAAGTPAAGTPAAGTPAGDPCEGKTAFTATSREEAYNCGFLGDKDINCYKDIIAPWEPYTFEELYTTHNNPTLAETCYPGVADERYTMSLSSSKDLGGTKCDLNVRALPNDYFSIGYKCPSLTSDGDAKIIKSLSVPGGVTITLRDKDGRDLPDIVGPATITDMNNARGEEKFLTMKRRIRDIGGDTSYLDYVQLYSGKAIYTTDDHKFGEGGASFKPTAELRCNEDYNDDPNVNNKCRGIRVDSNGHWKEVKKHTDSDDRVHWRDEFEMYIPNGNGYVYLFSYENYNDRTGGLGLDRNRQQRLNILGIGDNGSLSSLAPKLRAVGGLRQINSIILPRGVKVTLTGSSTNSKIILTGPIAIPAMEIAVDNGINVNQESAIIFNNIQENDRKDRWSSIQVELFTPTDDKNKLTLDDLTYYYRNFIIFKIDDKFKYIYKIVDTQSNYIGIPNDRYTEVLVPPSYKVNLLFSSTGFSGGSWNPDSNWDVKDVTYNDKKLNDIQVKLNLGQKIYGINVRQLE